MIRYLILLFIIVGCTIEKQDLTDTDPVFRNEENIIVSAALNNQIIPIPDTQRVLDWEYADYFSENSNVNHFFANEFTVKDKISFGWPSKNRYGRTSMPIIANNTIYICNGNGTLFAFDLLDHNKEIWSKTSFSFDRSISSYLSFLNATLSYGNDKIFMATNDGFLIAVNSITGAKKWSINLENPLRSAFKYDNGVVYGVSSNNKVFAINANTGEIIWKYEHTDSLRITLDKPSILLLDDKIIAAFSTSEAVALSKDNGKIVWTAEVNYKDGDNMFRMIDIDTTPTKIGDYVMIGGINGNVQFIRQDNGQVVSGYFGSLSSSVVSVEDFVFFMDKDSRLICFHIPSGGVKWFKDFENKKTLAIPAYLNDGNNKINVGFTYGGPILIDGKIVIINQFGEMFIIDPQNGDIQKKIKISSDIHKNPIVVDGKIYLIDDLFGNILIM
jgi:outer membrane protein assembly factor BamB